MSHPSKAVHVIDRPFTITLLATGTSYPLNSDEVRNLLDEYPVITATRNRLVLPGHNTSDPKQRVIIRPATLGGGPAFIVSR
jgi:hypothetical protein